jgi:hypothetical protein
MGSDLAGVAFNLDCVGGPITFKGYGRSLVVNPRGDRITATNRSRRPVIFSFLVTFR